jgi:hypothetical protein
MRIRISVDGASTRQLRMLLEALHKAGLPRAQVGVEGPEQWSAKTQPMYPSQFAAVVGELVTSGGKPIVQLVDTASPRGWQ